MIEKVKQVKTVNNAVSSVLVDIVLKYIELEKMSKFEKIYFIKNYLSQVINSSYLREGIVDEDAKALWYISLIEKERYYYVEDLEDCKFVFNDITINMLLEELNNKEKMMMHNYNYIKNETFMKLLSTSIDNGILTTSDSDEFPSILYEAKIIQRIMINKDLVEKNLSANQVKILIDNIDFNYKFY